MASINCLNDDCLLGIFKFIPLEDRVTGLIKVSIRWKKLALQSIECIKRLTINEKNLSMLEPHWSQIKTIKSLRYDLDYSVSNVKLISRIPDHILSNLIELATNITICVSKDIPRILKLSKKLNSLKLILWLPQRPIQTIPKILKDNCHEFFCSIGPQLKYLEINELFPLENLPDLKYMPNLVELMIYHWHMTIANGAYFVPNPNLTKLKIHLVRNPFIVSMHENMIISLSQAYPNLKHLTMDLGSRECDFEPEIWLRLTKLSDIEALNINFPYAMYELEPTLLSSLIKPMKNLIILSLCMQFKYSVKTILASCPQQLRYLILNGEELHWSERSPTNIAKIHTVESSTLRSMMDEAVADIVSHPRVEQLVICVYAIKNPIRDRFLIDVERRVRQDRKFRFRGSIF